MPDLWTSCLPLVQCCVRWEKDTVSLRGDIETVEPLLRGRATCEIDTSTPLDEVVAAVLTLAGAMP